MKMKLSCAMVLSLAMLLSNVIAGNTYEESQQRHDSVYKGHEDTFDYIIVGFGTAGAVLARQLSNKKHGKYKYSVLVLEAGQNNYIEGTPEAIPTFDPLPLGPSTSILTYNPLYAATYPMPVGLLDSKIYSEGREWGGSSAHNGLEAVRGIPADWDTMASNAGDNRWRYENVLQWMINLETFTGTTDHPNQRGDDGDIFITQKQSLVGNPFALAIATTTQAPLEPDYNDQFEFATITSASQLFVTPGNNPQRSFAASEMMEIGKKIDKKGRGLHGRKVRVMGNAVVSHLLFDESHSKTVVGVEYSRYKPSKNSEENKKVYARKKVILCAGAINSPAILMRSGIGDKTYLKSIDVDVVLDNPNVGAHLQNHYGTLVQMTHPGPAIPGGQLENFYDLPLATSNRRIIQQVAFELAEIAPGLFLAGLFGLLIQPESLGTVKIVSKDPKIAPAINGNLYEDGLAGADGQAIVDFYHIAKDIATAAGGVVISPAQSVYDDGDQALFDVASSASGIFIAYHAAGTARVSDSKDDGVVDGKLHVHGIKNLMVADMSVMWPISSGNTCLPAYVIGAVAADILGRPVK